MHLLSLPYNREPNFKWRKIKTNKQPTPLTDLGQVPSPCRVRYAPPAGFSGLPICDSQARDQRGTSSPLSLPPHSRAADR